MLLSTPPAQKLHIDHAQKIIVAERANLIFVFNFSVGNSVDAYSIQVPGFETRKLILDTDQPDTGGHGRVDYSATYPVSTDGMMQIYSPSRSGLVYAKK